MSKPTIFSVVVTYNRCALLSSALKAHVAQVKQADRVLVVNNASDDGTVEMLSADGWLARPNIQLLSLASNTGGAGGFSVGVQHAIESGAEWIWMMDDDAEPHADALGELMKIASDPSNLYGSLAINGDEPAWETTLRDPSLGKVQRITDIPDRAEVEMLPFLGMLLHRDLVARIGVPDADFFISGDDAEYCVRAKRAGAQIIIAGRSKINHPKSITQHLNVFGRHIIHLSIPPWKRYYDTRNRILISRKYYGFRLLYQTIPGSFVRLFFTLFRGPDRWMQVRAITAGLVDGILGLKGRRHDMWGIR